MKKTLIAFYILLFVLLFPGSKTFAFEREAGSTAMLASRVIVKDPRVAKLENFLNHYNPSISYTAPYFVNQADQYGLDWKFVAAIAGVESTFCKQIPSESYNCWGWGIPTGSKSGKGFSSYNDGISQVSSGLRSNYVDQGLLSVEQIGNKYAASQSWAYKVRYFMNLIDAPSKELVLSPEFLL